MISHQHRFVFVHTAKSGGTSIEAALADDGIVLQGPANFDSIYYKHAPAERIHRALGDEYDSYFSFAWVRDPWDWIVSQYSFNRGLTPPHVLRTAHPLRGSMQPPYDEMPFDRWLPWWFDTFAPNQSEMLCAPDGSLLVEMVGRFERLQEDFDLVCDSLGRPRVNLEHHKASDRGPTESYYDDALAQLVRDRCAQDFDRFGYDPDGPTGASSGTNQ